MPIIWHSFFTEGGNLNLAERNCINCGEDLFDKLIEASIISPSDMSVIDDAFRTMQREDLRGIIKGFYKKNQS